MLRAGTWSNDCRSDRRSNLTVGYSVYDLIIMHPIISMGDSCVKYAAKSARLYARAREAPSGRRMHPHAPTAISSRARRVGNKAAIKHM